MKAIVQDTYGSQLNDLDLTRAPEDSWHTFIVNTALPPEALRGETIDEDGPGELEAGEAG